MNKLKIQSMDKVQDNIEKIREMFPNAVTEVKRGEKTELAVDFDVLKQELADTLIDERELRYQFTWPDKQKSILLANTPVTATLRPDREKSVDFDNTQNLYIEGDNLDVLKLLRETYLGKIKMIYIDPPYNTGNDFVYEDDFALEGEEYKYGSGQYDEDRNRLFQNTDSNGRFHTDWLNMIYPRLKVAKDLLSDDGVIFISIDDNEVENLKKICDEIFGERNYISTISRLMKSGGNNGDFYSPNIDYILVFAKSKINVRPFKGELDERLIDEVYNKVEKEGVKAGERYRTMGLYQASLTLERSSNARYWITCPDGSKCIPPMGKRWRVIEPSFVEMLERGDIEFIKTTHSPLFDQNNNPSKWNVYTKIWLKDRLKEGQKPSNFISSCENRHSAKELNSLDIPFDFAKYSGLIKLLIKTIDVENDITILDFFSGSATTAHAVMQLNAEDGGNRKFIMVQLPEPCDEKSEAYKAGYKTICDIGEERIRRAGKKIMKELGVRGQELGKSGQLSLDDSLTTNSSPLTPTLDIGFRVLRLDSSNMREVYYHPEQYSQSLLDDLTDNIKEDRTPLDLLFQVMLDLGVKPSAKIEEKDIAGKHVFGVNENELIACFDDEITDEVVKAIAQYKPLYAAFRDSSLASDSVAANFAQIFATYSPNTKKEIL